MRPPLNRPLTALLAVGLCTSVAFAEFEESRPGTTLFVTGEMTIDCEDTTYDGFDIVVMGEAAVLTVDCAHDFASITVLDGGQVQHAPGGSFHLTLPEVQDPAGVVDASASVLHAVAERIPGGSLLPGDLQSDDAVRVIPERKGELLADGLFLDIRHPGEFSLPEDLQNWNFGRGWIVDSYILHFDPTGTEDRTVTASLTFDTDILGIEVVDSSLDATDDFGVEALVYPTQIAGRGLELDGTAAGDSLCLQGDRRNLFVRLSDRDGFDQIRVLVRSRRDDLIIDENSAIDVSGQGHGPATGPGAGESGTEGGGGGYGGEGGDSAGGAEGGPTYGSVLPPFEPGSGGGNAGLVPGGAGGGDISINVGGTIRVDGYLGAAGGNGLLDRVPAGGGGGSGGGIALVCAVLEGFGRISVDGGNAVLDGGGGGGGGGRLSIDCTDIRMSSDNFSAAGGVGFENGQPGSIVAGSVIVNPEGTGDYPTIQEAANLVPEFTIVRLADGTYTGPGNRDIDPGGKDLIFQSDSGDPAACIIDCQGSAADPHRAFHFHSGETSRSLVKGITIENGWVVVRGREDIGAGGGILVEQGSFLDVEDVIFRNNRSESGGGGMHYDAPSPGRDGNTAGKVQGVFFEFNQSESGGGGMHYSHGVSGNVDDVVFFANQSLSGGAGLYVAGGGAQMVISSCSFVGQSGPAVFLGDGAVVTFDKTIIAFGDDISVDHAGNVGLGVYCTDVFGNLGGDFVGILEGYDRADAGPGGLPGFGNFSWDPLFVDWQNAVLLLQPESPCLPENNQCGVLIGAEGPLDWYVPRPLDEAGEKPDPDVPTSVFLEPNSPNPFNPLTEIRFGLPRATAVRLDVFDLAGRRVRTLVDGSLPAGPHRITWDGRDHEARSVAAGVYVARLSADGMVATQRMTLVR